MRNVYARFSRTPRRAVIVAIVGGLVLLAHLAAPAQEAASPFHPTAPENSVELVKGAIVTGDPDGDGVESAYVSIVETAPDGFVERAGIYEFDTQSREWSAEPVIDAGDPEAFGIVDAFDGPAMLVFERAHGAVLPEYWLRLPDGTWSTAHDLGEFCGGHYGEAWDRDGCIEPEPVGPTFTATMVAPRYFGGAANYCPEDPHFWADIVGDADGYELCIEIRRADTGTIVHAGECGDIGDPLGWWNQENGSPRHSLPSAWTPTPGVSAYQWRVTTSNDWMHFYLGC